MRKLIFLICLTSNSWGQLCNGISLGRTIVPTFSTPSGTLGPGGILNGFTRFPTSAIYTDISAVAADTHSASWVCAIRNCNSLGGGTPTDRRTETPFNIIDSDSFLEAWFGIPWQVFDNSATRIGMSFTAPDGSDGRSDPGPYVGTLVYPLVNGSYGPASAGYPNFSYIGDKQIWSVNRDNCLAEISWNNYYIPPTGTQPLISGVGAVFDMQGGDHQRPYGIPSESVSGMPGISTFYTYEEMQAGIAQELISPGTGTLGHTLAFTALCCYLSSMSYTGMATSHQFSGPWLATTPPFGAILRLKPGYDGSAFRTFGKVIINTLKKYGAVFRDGGVFGLYAATDTRWDALDTEDLWNLKVDTTNWDFVQTGTIYCDPSETCGNQPPATPLPGVSTFTSTSSSGPGSAVTLSWTGVTNRPNSRTSFITSSRGVTDLQVGPTIASSMVVHPNVNTTYTLMIQNGQGRVTRTVNVTVPNQSAGGVNNPIARSRGLGTQSRHKQLLNALR